MRISGKTKYGAPDHKTLLNLESQVEYFLHFYQIIHRPGKVEIQLFIWYHSRAGTGLKIYPHPVFHSSRGIVCFFTPAESCRQEGKVNGP